MYRISGIASKPDGRINFSHILIQEAKNKKNEHELINEIEKYKRLSNSGFLFECPFYRCSLNCTDYFVFCFLFVRFDYELSFIK